MFEETLFRKALWIIALSIKEACIHTIDVYQLKKILFDQILFFFIFYFFLFLFDSINDNKRKKRIFYNKREIK